MKLSCWELLELILNSIYFAICLTSFIWRLTKPEAGKIFVEFEMWSVMGQMAYYIIFLIIGFKRLFSKEEEDNNNCKKFLKNIIFKYLWPFVMNSFAVFYLGYNFEWFELDKDQGNKFTLSIFLHGLSQAGFLIDIILFGREYKPTHIFDFIVISGMYVGYCILLFSTKPEIPAYKFLNNDENNKKKNNSFIVSLMIICYFVYLYLYFVYMYIVKFKSGVAKICGGDEKPESKKEGKEKKKKKEKETPLIEEKEANKKEKEKEEEKEEKEENDANQQDENDQIN